MSKKDKCPRCKSERQGQRLDGSRYCKYCGQRWAVIKNSNKGSKDIITLMPSFDKRERIKLTSGE